MNAILDFLLQYFSKEEILCAIGVFACGLSYKLGRLDEEKKLRKLISKYIHAKKLIYDNKIYDISKGRELNEKKE